MYVCMCMGYGVSIYMCMCSCKPVLMGVMLSKYFTSLSIHYTATVRTSFQTNQDQWKRVDWQWQWSSAWCSLPNDTLMPMVTVHVSGVFSTFSMLDIYIYIYSRLRIKSLVNTRESKFIVTSAKIVNSRKSTCCEAESCRQCWAEWIQLFSWSNAQFDCCSVVHE